MIPNLLQILDHALQTHIRPATFPYDSSAGRAEVRAPTLSGLNFNGLLNQK